MHIPFKPSLQAILVLSLCQTLTIAHAQVTETKPSAQPDGAAIARDRNATRQQIERVTSDQPGELDNATTLGRTLPAAFQSTQAVRERATASSPPADLRVPERPTTLDALPVQRPTGTRKQITKPTQANGYQTDKGNPVFTPDFSRQRLTLARLIDRTIIDLPNQEVGSIDDNNPLPRQSFEPDQALNLFDMVATGIDYSPVLDQSRSQLNAAVARTQQTRADLLPRVTVRIAKGPEESQASGAALNQHNTANSAIRLVQPVVNIPAARDFLSEVENRRSATWRLDASRESVALSVTKAFADLATARLVLEFSDQQLQQFNELLDYVQKRAQTGAASVADLERTRARVLLARQIRIEQQATYRNALLELERLTGQTPVAMVLPYLNQLPGLPATQFQLRRLVWEHNHDLRALRSDVESQKNQVASQYAKLLPTLDISLERDESSNVRAITPTQTDNRVMAVVNWGASLAGKEIYGGRAAASELGNREAKLTEEGERVMQSIDADFALLQSATLRINTGEAELRATSAVVESVRELLKTGRPISLLEALDAVDRHFGARQRLAQTINQQMQAHAQLLRRLGLLSALSNMANVQISSAQATQSIVEKSVPEASTVPTIAPDKPVAPAATPVIEQTK